MAAFTNMSCSIKSCQNPRPKKIRTIFVKNKGYIICEKCFEWFRKIGQLILE